MSVEYSTPGRAWITSLHGEGSVYIFTNLRAFIRSPPNTALARVFKARGVVVTLGLGCMVKTLHPGPLWNWGGGRLFDWVSPCSKAKSYCETNTIKTEASSEKKGIPLPRCLSSVQNTPSLNWTRRLRLVPANWPWPAQCPVCPFPGHSSNQPVIPDT